MSLTRKVREGAESSDTPEEEAPLRLQVFLAHAGVASRRASEGLIAEGRVSVNGRVITLPGEKVFPGDEVLLDGKAVSRESRLLYLALNKPPLFLCSSSDPEGRRLAGDLLPADIGERLYNVGRLDYRSSGLIFYTNDGDFAARISHPASGIVKEYEVEASGPIPDSFVAAFRDGIDVEGVRYHAEEIERTGRRSVRIALVEGKNREIRRVFSHFHLHPAKLERVRIGPVYLGALPEGQSRPLTEEELEKLK